MARGVNVTLGKWRRTGNRVRVDQFAVDMSVSWTDESGIPRTWSGTVMFPDALALAPRTWSEEEVQDLAMRALFRRLKVDEGR